MASLMEGIMTNDRSDRRYISRRAVLGGATLAFGAAAAVVASRAEAQQQLTQSDAKYQTMPKGDQRCSGCYNFQPPGACKFVQGDISPSGWCQLFAPKT